MLVPSNGKLLIKKSSFDLRSSGGIFYPDNAKESDKRRIIGQVLAVAEDVQDVHAGDYVLFDNNAGLGLIGSDHFDLDDDGLPAVGFGAPSDKRNYCIVAASDVLMIIDDFDAERIN